MKRIYISLLVIVFTVGINFQALLAQSVNDSSNKSEFLSFACNAGNAGNAGLIKSLKESKLPLDKVLNEILTRYNGPIKQPLRLFVSRIQNGEVVAYDMSRYLEMKPGDIIPTRRFGYPKIRRLYPADVSITGKHIQFITEHIDAGTFLNLIKEGNGDKALQIAPGSWSY